MGVRPPGSRGSFHPAHASEAGAGCRRSESARAFRGPHESFMLSNRLPAAVRQLAMSFGDPPMRIRFGLVIALVACVQCSTALAGPQYPKAKYPKPWSAGRAAPRLPSPLEVPPPNDQCSGAILLGCGNIVLSGNTTSATNDYTFADSTLSCTGFTADGHDVAYN